VPLRDWSFTVTGPGLPDGSVTVLTDADGYVFVEVNCSGTYVITEADVTGWIHTTEASLSVTVKSGDVVGPQRFGNFKLGRIEGMKTYDQNLNGIGDPGEPGLVGWTIVITGTTVKGPFVNTTTTDSNGHYEFNGLYAGVYIVSEVLQPGWVPTSPPTSPAMLIGSGVTGLANFDNALFGIIEGYKFYDKDMDGVRDDGEPGLGGWVIHLDGETDQGVVVDRTATTDSNGHFLFGEVQPGTYEVSEELPGTEWMNTTELPIVVDEQGATESFDVSVEIGNVRFAKIEGYKFLDTYSQSYPFWPNGLFDPWEVGLGNWRITLEGYTDTGVRVAEVRFTNNVGPIGTIGWFEFTDVLPGTYWLNETRQNGFVSTTPYAVLLQVYPFPLGPVVIRHDFGNLVPSADPTLLFVLEKGWNLWSSPLSVSGLTAKSLLNAIGSNAMAVSRLDSAKVYHSYVKGYDSAYDFPIALGEGYFVYVKQKTTFALTGLIEEGASASVTKGWNIVGYGKLEPMTASQLLASVAGCNAKAVTYLDATTGVYHSYVKGYPAAYDFTITQGRAFFLWVDGAGSVAF
jgi:hypothetical protein